MANLKIIRALCKERRIPLNELAAQLNMQQSGLHRILSKNTTKIETLEKIAEILKVNISVFFTDPVTDEFQSDALKKMLDKLPRELGFVKQVYDMVSENHQLKEDKNDLEIEKKVRDSIISFLLKGNRIPRPGDPETPEEFDTVFDFIEEVHTILTKDMREGETNPISDLPNQIQREYYNKGDQAVENLFIGRIKKEWDGAYRQLFKIPFVQQLFRNGETSHPLLKSFWDDYANKV